MQENQSEKTDLSLAQAQKLVDNWIFKYGVRYFDELTNLALLTEEVGEVARLMARKYGMQSAKISEPESDLADELSDVLFVLICIANQTGVDLQTAFIDNINKKTDRDHLRHKQNPKL